MPKVVIDFILGLRTAEGLVAATIAVVEVLKYMPVVKDWLAESDRNKRVAGVVVTFALGGGAYAAAVALGLEEDGSLLGALGLLVFLAAVAQVVYDKVIQPLRKLLK